MTHDVSAKAPVKIALILSCYKLPAEAVEVQLLHKLQDLELPLFTGPFLTVNKHFMEEF